MCDVATSSQAAEGKLKVILSVIQHIFPLACHVSDLFRVPNDSMMLGKESEVADALDSLIWTKESVTSFYLTPKAQIQCGGSCLGFEKIPPKLLSLGISL